MKMLILAVLCSFSMLSVAQDASVVFYRPWNHRGGFSHTSLRVDGNVVHKLRSERFWETKLPIGQHRICADRCGRWGQAYGFAAGQTYYFRVQPHSPVLFGLPGITVVPVRPQRASQELKDLKADN